MQKTTKTRAISAANIAALAAIVEGAKKTGTVEAGALDRIEKAMLREQIMKEEADYMGGKDLTSAERRKIAALLAKPTVENASAIEKMAETFRRGDYAQLIEAMEQDGHQSADLARAKVNLASTGLIRKFTLDTLADFAAMNGVAVSLKTVRAERPTYSGPRVSLNLNTVS